MDTNTWIAVVDLVVVLAVSFGCLIAFVRSI